MKKNILMILVGIFILPNLCESYLSMNAKIEKSHQTDKGTGDDYIHKSDSVSVNYDAFTGTISISTTSESKNVGIKIYSVEAGSTVCHIPADNLPSGVYQVTMVENGVVTGIKKFTK